MTLSFLKPNRRGGLFSRGAAHDAVNYDLRKAANELYERNGGPSEKTLSAYKAYKAAETKREK
ncbi:MAG TPA: hypothetical protein VF744_07470 [Beijerinckiaceae bacterium]|jgi:hypothetical protein